MEELTLASDTRDRSLVSNGSSINGEFNKVLQEFKIELFSSGMFIEKEEYLRIISASLDAEKEIADIKRRVEEKNHEIARLAHELNLVYGSKKWRLVALIARVKSPFKFAKSSVKSVLMYLLRNVVLNRRLVCFIKNRHWLKNHFLMKKAKMLVFTYVKANQAVNCPISEKSKGICKDLELVWRDKIGA